MTLFDNAKDLIRKFKGSSYVFGFGVLGEAGRLAANLGRRAVLVHDEFPGAAASVDRLRASLAGSGVEVIASVRGAAPNAPLEDLARVTALLVENSPDVVVSFGGGSTIDCAKAAEVLRTLGGRIEDYFGVSLVSARIQATGLRLTPHLAIQTAASSAAHLTKYSNITDLSVGQKKLIVDDAVVPQAALFDYEVTLGAPGSLTADGALDGLSHCLEVYYGATGKPSFELTEQIALTAIDLVLRYLPRVVSNPADREAREALGLATDLGGYAIMVGGTNGAHLTSFSFIDILSHGRACALMNPYYTVFFSPAIQHQLRALVGVARQAGLIPDSEPAASGRGLAEQFARALIVLQERAGNPTCLSEVNGFSPAHVERALAAAKNPQLRMKLENMPVALKAEQVDDYMAPILEAASAGQFAGIRNLA